MHAVYQLVLKGYDRWIQNAKQKGQTSGETESRDFSPIELGYSPNYTRTRWTPLANGTSVWMHARPATVADGKLTQGLLIVLFNQQRSGNVRLMAVMISNEGYFVSNDMSGKLTFATYEKGSVDPADEDMEFLERIIVGINQAMGYVTREVEASKVIGNVTK